MPTLLSASDTGTPANCWPVLPATACKRGSVVRISLFVMVVCWPVLCRALWNPNDPQDLLTVEEGALRRWNVGEVVQVSQL